MGRKNYRQGMGHREGKREREIERQTDRDREKQRQIQTVRQTDREMGARGRRGRRACGGLGGGEGRSKREIAGERKSCERQGERGQKLERGVERVGYP